MVVVSPLDCVAEAVASIPNGEVDLSRLVWVFAVAMDSMCISRLVVSSVLKRSSIATSESSFSASDCWTRLMSLSFVSSIGGVSAFTLELLRDGAKEREAENAGELARVLDGDNEAEYNDLWIESVTSSTLFGSELCLFKNDGDSVCTSEDTADTADCARGDWMATSICLRGLVRRTLEGESGLFDSGDSVGVKDCTAGSRVKFGRRVVLGAMVPGVEGEEKSSRMR